MVESVITGSSNPCINSPTTQLRKLQDSIHTCRLWPTSTSRSFTAYLRDFLLKFSVLPRRPPLCLTSEKSEGSLQSRLPSVLLNYSFFNAWKGRGSVETMYKTGGQQGMNVTLYSTLSPPREWLISMPLNHVCEASILRITLSLSRYLASFRLWPHISASLFYISLDQLFLSFKTSSS
jgi:hypothetical protein